MTAIMDSSACDGHVPMCSEYVVYGINKKKHPNKGLPVGMLGKKYNDHDE
jgi:hypothetical protein